MTEAQYVFLIAFIACIAHGIFQALVRAVDGTAKPADRFVDASFALFVDFVVAYLVMLLWEHWH
jgi:hypothetical protein